MGGRDDRSDIVSYFAFMIGVKKGDFFVICLIEIGATE